ncbi:annexin A13-like [Cloeon dipterum]|uniref:annexin A13-like n=1 Tax=Cloeon dipterum TaxID=197152 RepID=UPI003220235F
MARLVLLLLSLVLCASIGHAQNDPKPKPTVFPGYPFDAEADADNLHEAMNSQQQSNPLAIESILSRRSLQQRLTIAEKYKLSYGKNLESDITKYAESCLTCFSFGRMGELMFSPLPVQYSHHLSKAMVGPGTTESVLTEILCGNKNNMIRNITQAYAERYDGKSLLADLEGETSGDLKSLLVLLMQANRTGPHLVNAQAVKDDVLALYNNGEINWREDSSRLNEVLARRSVQHIRWVLQGLSRKTGKNIKENVDEQFYFGNKKGYLACVRMIQEPEEYFADVLNDAINGLGTSEDALIRVILTRSEIDLGTISEKYEQKYGRSVIDDIKGDTGGFYKNMLLAFFGEDANGRN